MAASQSPSATRVDSAGLCRLASLAKRGELPGTTSGAGMTLGGRDMRNIDEKHAMIHMARQVLRLHPTPSPYPLTLALALQP